MDKQPDEEVHRVRSGRGPASGPLSLWNWTASPSQHVDVLTTLEGPEPRDLGALIKILSHRHHHRHQPLVTELSLRLLFPPRVRDGAESSDSLIRCLVFLGTSPHPEAIYHSVKGEQDTAGPVRGSRYRRAQHLPHLNAGRREADGFQSLHLS